MDYVYLLKIRRIYAASWSESDLVFRSTLNTWSYLQDLWEYWETIYTPEELERIPPIPTLAELRNGLKHSNKYTMIEVGFLDDDSLMSLYVTVERMFVH